MDTRHLYQGTKMQNRKKLTFDVHLNNKSYHWCGQNKSYDLLQVFMAYLLISYGIYLAIIGDYLLRNIIFLDKVYDLSTYLIRID